MPVLAAVTDTAAAATAVHLEVTAAIEAQAEVIPQATVDVHHLTAAVVHQGLWT